MKQLFIAMALVAACTQPADVEEIPVDPDPPEVTVASIQFAPGLNAAASNQFDDEFSLLGQRDIIAVIEIPVDPGLHFLRFELLNPEGGILQSSIKAFSTDASPGETITHPTLGETIRVDRVSRDDEGFVKIRGLIPVAGSNFTRYRLQGTFTAQVFVGLEEESVTVENSFLMKL